MPPGRLYGKYTDQWFVTSCETLYLSEMMGLYMRRKVDLVTTTMPPGRLYGKFTDQRFATSCETLYLFGMMGL